MFGGRWELPERARAMLGDLPVGVRAHALSAAGYAPPDFLAIGGLYRVPRARSKTEPASMTPGSVPSSPSGGLVRGRTAADPAPRGLVPGGEP